MALVITMVLVIIDASKVLNVLQVLGSGYLASPRCDFLHEPGQNGAVWDHYSRATRLHTRSFVHSSHGGGGSVCVCARVCMCVCVPAAFFIARLCVDETKRMKQSVLLVLALPLVRHPRMSSIIWFGAHVFRDTGACVQLCVELHAYVRRSDQSSSFSPA